MIISQQKDLENLLPKLENAQVVAIDTEFERRTTYYPVLSLLQLNVDNDIYLLDAHGGKLDLSALKTWWQQPSAIKVFHAGYQDVAILNYAVKATANNIFDTQLALQLLGTNEQVSYENLVSSRLSVQLSKAHQQSNWLRRPLSKAQLEYARNDVRYLPDLYQQLNDEIITRDRVKWLTPKLTLLSNSQIERDIEYGWITMVSPQASHLSRVRLKNLFIWRESRAQKLNRPPTHLINNHYLCQVALGIIQPWELPKEVSTSVRDEVIGIIEACSPENDYITQEERYRIRLQCLTRLEQARLAQLKELLREKAASLEIAPIFLANRDEAREVVVLYTLGKVEEAAMLNDWRAEFTRELVKHLEKVSG